MSLTAETIIDQAARELNDSRANAAADRTWSDPVLIAYLNNGIIQIALVRPDLSAKTASVKLVPGTRQALPADAARLLSVVRNRGATGTVDGLVITQADRDSLDAVSPAWHASRAAAVRNYVYDLRFGTAFYVYPGATDTIGVWVELIYSAIFTVTGLQDVVPLSDLCLSPLKHWIKYECLGKETDDATSAERGQAHYTAFFQELGVKTTTDSSLPPD
ncbi:MAG: DUF6682 family protein [Solidesulfovibrio sp.]|uniref:phage adaptor protein n=1 Tax=Solidesulfovibrio sp. TaxID=2910990 RepID=UPI002B1FF408|nr:DUF6682 family protein [Solidesulfovibrio sp.]MEA4857906.1 DUF6682 family protein [Solidesulfovibrio sp.]